MISTRNYKYTEGRIGRYKYTRTSTFDGLVAIYIKKRFLGFLWFVFVKDRFGSPICFNKQNHAESFMRGEIKYEERIDSEYKLVGENMIETVFPMTDERAINKICNIIYDKTGETVPYNCAKEAWNLEGRQYTHRAADIAELWNQIYKFNGKKPWEKQLQNQ
jgi:hypothetical protein